VTTIADHDSRGLLSCLLDPPFAGDWLTNSSIVCHGRRIRVVQGVLYTIWRCTLSWIVALRAMRSVDAA
jgi:hypothetical protein